MLRFEQYLEEFTNTISLPEFLLNLVITALVAAVLRWFYIQYSNSVSNRKRFAANFLPLALATMLIITIVKSSIALSLGLVGALSIVRFRAAIKDPEELTFLFLVIGLGLATGANQPLLAMVAFAIILLLLWIHKRLEAKTPFRNENKMYINIQTDLGDISQVSEVLTKNLPYVELKYMHTLENGLDLSFICKADNLKQLDDIKNQLKQLSPATQLSIIDQPDLIV